MEVASPIQKVSKKPLAATAVLKKKPAAQVAIDEWDPENAIKLVNAQPKPVHISL